MLGLAKGLQATISHLFTKKATVQYPEQRSQLPERSRGLIRLRLKEDGTNPRCISCTFCEQVCPSIAIKVVYDYRQPEEVWSFDAGAGPMLSFFNRGEAAVGMEPWPAGEGAVPAADDGCLAEAFVGAGRLTSLAIAAAARRRGVWLSQAFGVATYYDQLRPDGPGLAEEEPMPPVHGAVTDCPAVVSGGFGAVDPESIDSYAGAGGYKMVTGALTEMTPDGVIEEIGQSGLRGRGGGGFPTGEKWRVAAAGGGGRKYIVANGGDGDLGSFKDRAIMELNPHSLIEGMIIAAYAVGAGEGFICLHAEDRTAVERVRKAVEQARDRDLLGRQLPGTGFSFDIRVVALPAAYAGGEETALLNALEGRRPQPRVRPPYPAEKGLFGAPTLVQDVETLAAVPWILKRGADRFREIGASGAPGTKLFTLSGAVSRPGVYEAPMDISLKRLVEEEAGGFAGQPKAALVGDGVGGFLPPGLMDIPLDFDSLRETGGDLSSGAIEVLGADACIVERVRLGLARSSSQSCGKCVPDRLGTWRLLEIIERLCAGEAREGDLDLARDLAEDVAAGSLCGLGRGAVRPLLTGLKFFADEFSQHAAGNCPAGRCGM